MLTRWPVSSDDQPGIRELAFEELSDLQEVRDVVRADDDEHGDRDPRRVDVDLLLWAGLRVGGVRSVIDVERVALHGPDECTYLVRRVGCEPGAYVQLRGRVEVASLVCGLLFGVERPDRL